MNTDDSKRVWGKFYANGVRSRYEAFGVGSKIVVRPVPALQLSLALDSTSETDRQRCVKLIPVNGPAGWYVSRLAGKLRSLAFRAEWNFRPELSLQYYGNPFGSTLRFSEFRRVLAPEAADYVRRFGAMLPARLEDGRYSFDENGDGLIDYQLDDPDGNGASLRSNLVLKWEYRCGSTLYLVWSQQRNGATASKDEDAWSVLGGLRHQPPNNQFMVNVTCWFSS